MAAANTECNAERLSAWRQSYEAFVTMQARASLDLFLRWLCSKGHFETGMIVKCEL